MRMESLILCLSLGVVACVSEVPGDTGGAGEATDVAALSASSADAPKRTAGWANIDAVPYSKDAVKLGAAGAGAALSLEELAEALRPVMSTPSGTMIAREPNWDAASAAQRSGDGSLAYVPGEVGPMQVIGPDGRTRVPVTTIAPFSSMAQIWVALDGGTFQCTGTYIGPWTFITAGHCLRMADGTVTRRITFNAARNGGSFPFGSIACANDDASRSNDFFAAIPAGFAASADPNFDFAVIDTYPCHAAQRWLGMPASNQGVLVNSGDTTYSLHGYPAPACIGAPGGFDYNCGMSGPAYVNGNWVESAEIDSEGGQSGGPWHIAGRVAATHIGYREYGDLFRCGFDVCRRNFGRRIDTAYKSFLDEIAYDYP
ncbi:MAG TPA: hypothetical protein VIX73_31715 [Kofleriaceae bacterium]